MGDNFNDNLREARLKSGLSQKELSENIGVAKSTYSLYESGKREPNVDTIKKSLQSLTFLLIHCLDLMMNPLPLLLILTATNIQKTN